MRRAVLWDSSALLALLDADDADHAVAAEIVQRLASERRPCFITNYLEVEAHALILRRLGRALAQRWLVSHGLPVVRTSPAEEDRAKELIVRHADKDWSLCDALSFAVIESRRVWGAFSFDRHFKQFGKCVVLGV